MKTKFMQSQVFHIPTVSQSISKYSTWNGACYNDRRERSDHRRLGDDPWPWPCLNNSNFR